jgi:hypothetical protein
MMRGTVFLALSMLTLAPRAFAQGDPPRGSVAGIVGKGQTWDDEGSMGTGVTVGGRVAWRLFANTSVEGAVELLTHDRSGRVFQSQGDSTILSASLVHRFGRAKVQPYVLEGLHVIHHSGTTRFDNRTFDFKSTDAGLHFGGGLAVRVGDRIEIGPEARFYIIRIDNDSDPAWANWIGARVGVRF